MTRKRSAAEIAEKITREDEARRIASVKARMSSDNPYKRKPASEVERVLSLLGLKPSE